MKKKISDPWIAQEKFNNISKIEKKLNYYKWIEFIEQNQDYFTWLENTEQGKKTLKNLDRIPESFKEGILDSHNKKEVLAEFNVKKGFHEVMVRFNKRLGVIGTTFQKPITKKHLKLLLNMAKYLDALLLKDGTEIIDEKVIEKLKV